VPSFVLTLGLIAATGAVACEPCDRARAFLAEGEPAKAEALLLDAARADKQDPAPHGWLVVALATQNRPREAADALRALVKRNPPPELWAALRTALPDLQTTPGVDVLFQCGEGVTPPILLESASAIYPPHARAAGVEMGVLVLAKVGPKGTVIEWDWDRTGPDWTRAYDGGFADAATTAVAKWRFFPALRDGVPVPCDFQADMTFRLLKGF
jgi:hypothetical protein